MDEIFFAIFEFYMSLGKIFDITKTTVTPFNFNPNMPL